jgi:hypothetical protein
MNDMRLRSRSFIPHLWLIYLAICLALACAEETSDTADLDVNQDLNIDPIYDANNVDLPDDIGAQDQLDANIQPELDADVQSELDSGSATRDAEVMVSDQGVEPELDAEVDLGLPLANPDLNADGQLNILIIGTSASIEERGEPFLPDQIATELQNILNEDTDFGFEINVIAEDIYRTQVFTTGYGQRGDTYEWQYHCHSLAQYYFWPEDRASRMARLIGEGSYDWDYVVIAGDPHIISTLPGYYSLGMNKVATKVAEGGAQPLLLMPWHRGDDTSSIEHFAEFAHRTSYGAQVSLPVIPAGVAWADLPDSKRDQAMTHPTPNGSYLAASTIYAHLYGRSASVSNYVYDDEIAEVAVAAVMTEASLRVDYEPRSFISPFHGGEITDRVLNFNHTGTSSENGILRGLRWVVAQGNTRLDRGGGTPMNFNYGRANTEFEPQKRYRIAPDEFDFSLGFPMQDHSNHGNVSMLYGLDKRRSNIENGTDLGVARKMARDDELPYARAVPIRTLFVQMKESIPNLSAYADGWHMNHDLDKATGAFMYTLLTGHCALPEEPADQESGEWRSWLAHKTGYETAWQLMHLSAEAPCLRMLPESVDSISVASAQETRLSISFARQPRHNVIVTLSADHPEVARINQTELVFTPEDYKIPQDIIVTGLDGEHVEDHYTITAHTQSEDFAFNDVWDRWTYTTNRE